MMDTSLTAALCIATLTIAAVRAESPGTVPGEQERADLNMVARACEERGVGKGDRRSCAKHSKGLSGKKRLSPFSSRDLARSSGRSPGCCSGRN